MDRALDRREMLRWGAAAAAGGIASSAFAATPALPRIEDLAPASPESVGMAADLTPRIAAFMRSQIEADRLTGGVTAVARRGRLIHFASHGLLDPAAGTAMTDDRIFRMMSSGKPITGVALLQQIEAGRVALDDKVSRFIPELAELRVRVGPPQAPGCRSRPNRRGARSPSAIWRPTPRA